MTVKCRRYDEDFEIGEVYRHRLGRVISKVDNTWFTLLTLNSNQNHFNGDYAKHWIFGRLVVNSGITIALIKLAHTVFGGTPSTPRVRFSVSGVEVTS